MVGDDSYEDEADEYRDVEDSLRQTLTTRQTYHLLAPAVTLFLKLRGSRLEVPM